MFTGLVEAVGEVIEAVPEGGYRASVSMTLTAPGCGMGPAIAEAAGAGFRRIVVIPFFLTLGTHLHRDLPRLVAAERKKQPAIEIRVGRSLEDHPAMASLVISRIREITEEARVSS